MRLVQLIVLIVILASSFRTFGQVVSKDSIEQTQNTIIIQNQDTLFTDRTAEEAELIKMYAERYNPRVAGLYSAVLPGLGQGYNKKFWKIPFVYGAFYGIYFQVDRFNTEYQEKRKGLLYALNNNSFDNESATYEINGIEYTEDNLRNRVNKFRRERDYWIILGSVWYLLQIADAHIDAHLREFDVNEKLKLSVDPTVSQSFNSIQGGLSLTLHFH